MKKIYIFIFLISIVTNLFSAEFSKFKFYSYSFELNNSNIDLSSEIKEQLFKYNIENEKIPHYSTFENNDLLFLSQDSLTPHYSFNQSVLMPFLFMFSGVLLWLLHRRRMQKRLLVVDKD